MGTMEQGRAYKIGPDISVYYSDAYVEIEQQSDIQGADDCDFLAVRREHLKALIDVLLEIAAHAPTA